MGLERLLGRARDWWTRRDDATLDGAAIDPAYNGWYVTAVPTVGADDASEDATEGHDFDDRH